VFFLLLAAAAFFFSWSPGKAGLFLVAGALSCLGVIQLVALGMLGELAVSTSDLTHTRMAEITRRIIPLSVEKKEVDTRGELLDFWNFRKQPGAFDNTVVGDPTFSPPHDGR
jgi:hypothetical protein